MARIAGVNIPSSKRIEIALTYIHGIGKNFSVRICLATNVDKRKRVNQRTLSCLNSAYHHHDVNGNRAKYNE